MNESLQLKVQRDLGTLKELVLKSSIAKNSSSPKYILGNDFYEKYIESQENNIRNNTGANPLFKYVNFQEFRIVRLSSCLNRAKLKFINRLPDVSSETSQLIITNNIIKRSFELTSYICLIDWLQSIYLKEDSNRIKLPEKVCLDNTIRKLGTNQKVLHPDLLFQLNGFIDNKEFENHSSILDKVLMNVRSGNLEEAQKIAEYYNQFNISAMLNGGLPFNDFKLDEEEKFENVDFDLFPPYMNTREMTEFKNYLKIVNENRGNLQNRRQNFQQIESINDRMIGNANWLLWLFANHHSASEDSQEKLTQIIMLQSYLSGNVSSVEKKDQSIYNKLYSNILSLFNLSLIEQYQLTEKIEYQYVDGIDVTKCYEKLKGKNIIEVINQIRSQQQYADIISKVFLC